MLAAIGGCLVVVAHAVAEHWWLKPEVPWVRLPATAGLFTFLYFCLITSKFNLFQLEARCSQHLAWMMYSTAGTTIIFPSDAAATIKGWLLFKGALT